MPIIDEENHECWICGIHCDPDVDTVGCDHCGVDVCEDCRVDCGECGDDLDYD